MNKLFAAFIFLCTSKSIYAQSIVSNGGFESISSCPDRVGGIELAQDWHKKLETPDLFSSCASTGYLGVPINYMGKLEAIEGKAYAGIVLYMTQPMAFHKAKYDYLRREDIVNYLASKTIKGKSYEFTIRYALADSSDFYYDHITISLSSRMADDYSSPYEQVIPLKLTQSREKKWSVAKAIFVAGDNWDLITIGLSRTLFSLNDYKKSLKSNKTDRKSRPGNKSCYYYIDNLSLSAVESK